MEANNRPEEIESSSSRRLFWPLLVGLIALNYLGGEMRFFPWRFLLFLLTAVFCVVIARSATRAGDKVTMVLAWFYAIAYTFLVLLGIGLIFLQLS